MENLVYLAENLVEGSLNFLAALKITRGDVTGMWRGLYSLNTQCKRWKIPTLILFHRAQNHLNYLGSGLNQLKQQNSTRNFCGLANFQISKYFLKKNVYRRWNQELHLGRSWWAQAPERTSRRCLDCDPWQGVQCYKISGRGKIISPLRERFLKFTISLLLPNICCYPRKDLIFTHFLS